MEAKCNDEVFGEMIYKHRWYKQQKEVIFGKEYIMTITAKAYSGKPITDEQRTAYKKYEEQKEAYFKVAGERIIEYVNVNLPELAKEWISARRMENISDLPAVVTPKTMLFKQDGTVLMLLECVWDEEHGLAVKLSPEIAIGSQDLFL